LWAQLIRLFIVVVLVLVPLLYSSLLKAQTASSAEALRSVSAIHGMAGPFAVAGYRMGERSLKELGLHRGSVMLDVTHRTPYQVQWSCVADGVQAATGASVGKLNLRLVEVPLSEMQTIIKDRATSKELVFRFKPSFTQRFLNLPKDKLSAAGAEVEQLSDDEIFSVELKQSSSATTN
jgi:formylmethanofuran dehydrogenase subunit E